MKETCSLERYILEQKISTKVFFYGKLDDIAVGPEVDDDFSEKYGLMYYGSFDGEFEGFALIRGNKIIESLSDMDEMPVIEDVLDTYLDDYLCVKEKIESGREVSDTERMYKILFDDFFSKEEIKELIKDIR